MYSADACHCHCPNWWARTSLFFHALLILRPFFIHLAHGENDREDTEFRVKGGHVASSQMTFEKSGLTLNEWRLFIADTTAKEEKMWG